MDKLRRVLNGREDNEELGLTAQVNCLFISSNRLPSTEVLFVAYRFKEPVAWLMVANEVSIHSAN